MSESLSEQSDSLVVQVIEGGNAAKGHRVQGSFILATNIDIGTLN